MGETPKTHSSKVYPRKERWVAERCVFCPEFGGYTAMPIMNLLAVAQSRAHVLPKIHPQQEGSSSSRGDCDRPSGVLSPRFGTHFYRQSRETRLEGQEELNFSQVCSSIKLRHEQREKAAEESSANRLLRIHSFALLISRLTLEKQVDHLI